MNWKYYTHAAVPTTRPHEEADLAPIRDASIWKLPGGGVNHYLHVG